MTTKKAKDFLDKELLVNHNIVTFRSLSRELAIHVNDAKNELQRYCDADARAVPTYLVSGEVPALMLGPHTETQQSDSTMDLDLEFEEDREQDVDVVYQNKVLLVDARALDETTSRFSRVYSVHIYSLSPSRLGDAGLVCTSSSKVHQADAQGGPKLFSVVGKITGSHVKLKAGVVAHKSTASSSKTTLDVPAKAALKAAASIKLEQQGKALLSDTKDHISATTPLPRTESKDRPKVPGKLDWSKAKTKEKELIAEKTREDKKPKPEPKTIVGAKGSLESKQIESTKLPISKSIPSGDAQQRGIKRKPRINSDFESESEPGATLSTSGGLSSKKGIVYSDEDDESEAQVRRVRRPQRKSTVMSDSEMSLRAIMDIDDDQVDRVSRFGKVRAQREEEEESSEAEKELPPVTSEGEDSDDVPVVPKKRKPRKMVPVGRNGLKKRRVVKSRTTTDAKGYMQTEDYSSYESVEEEVVVERKPKGKRRETKKEPEPQAETKTKLKVLVKEESTGQPKAKTAPKARGGASKPGGLLNFFGPDKGKK